MYRSCLKKVWVFCPYLMPHTEYLNRYIILSEILFIVITSLQTVFKIQL